MSNCVMFKGKPVDEMTRKELLAVIREIAQIMEDDRKRYKETIETLWAIRKA
jgi:hypothetical protein